MLQSVGRPSIHCNCKCWALNSVMQQGVGGGMDGQMGDSNKVAYYFMYGVKYGHYLGKGRTRQGLVDF